MTNVTVPVTLTNDTANLEIDITTENALPSGTHRHEVIFGIEKGSQVVIGLTLTDPVPVTPPEVPTVKITTNPSGANGTIGWQTTGTIASTTATLDRETIASLPTPGSYAYSGLAPGAHTFDVTVTDADGQTATTGVSWTVASPVGRQPNVPVTLLALINTQQTLLDTDFTQGKPSDGVWVAGNRGPSQQWNGQTMFTPNNIAYTVAGVRMQAGAGLGAILCTDPQGTSPGFQFTGGYLEFVATVDAVAGGGPPGCALWTCGQNWPADGEIDVLEVLAGDLTENYHSAGPHNANGNEGSKYNSYAGQRITYGVLRTATQYHYLVWNGEIVREYASDELAEQFLVLSINAGDGLPANGQGMTVERVTVWPLA